MNIFEKEVRNMHKIVEDHYYLNDRTSLIYSPDDSGWYIDDFKNNRMSAIYSTRGEACRAYTTDSVEWEAE